MQFINSSLEKLAKNISENGSENLMLLKQKKCLSLRIHGRFSEDKVPDKKCFCRSLKDGATGDNDEKLNGCITDEEYLACIKIWNEFDMKYMGDYHDHYLKKDVLLLADVFENSPVNY